MSLIIVGQAKEFSPHPTNRWSVSLIPAFSSQLFDDEFREARQDEPVSFLKVWRQVASWTGLAQGRSLIVGCHFLVLLSCTMGLYMKVDIDSLEMQLRDGS